MAAHHSKVAAASESTAYNISRQQKQAFLQGSADAHVSSLCWGNSASLWLTASLLGRSSGSREARTTMGGTACFR